MIGKIAADGYEISFEDIRAKTPTGRFNRSHIATHLVEKGYVSGVKEAFATLLAKDSKYYVPVRRVDTLDAIRFLRSIGAVPVLAHPYLDLTEEQLKEFLPLAVSAGLVGMEVYHPSHSKEQSEKAMELVRLHGLLPSGGSDYHGYRKPGIHLGSGEGNLQIPYTFCTDIEFYSTNTTR
jgi:predicted metal-dependent phosphoesterase TrpH